MPVNVITLLPKRTVAEQDASFGARLYERNPDQCCALRKVMPLREGLSGYVAWASGLRRDEAATRSNAKVVEWDAKRNMVKLNPIAAWTQDEADQYIADNNILVNPLLSEGYGSIGCAPCTRKGEGRSGRWLGMPKVECGLHE
jgi:phosphoadenosine phosphosulfate reductase